MLQRIDGIVLHRLFRSGYRNLKRNMETVNNLNVFPVPDGDTGTNMVHTFGGGLDSIQEDISHLGQYLKALSQGVLLSARGNSGVIFSQFVHGLCRGMDDLPTACFADLAKAFVCATQDSYTAVITPTEGTMLTVIREAANFLESNGDRYADLQSGIGALLEHMKQTLTRTPEMLAVLKEAGVVDSGGAGLVCFFEGIYADLCGEAVEDTVQLAEELASPAVNPNGFGPDSQLTYGYCTEFILQLLHAKTDISEFRMDRFLEPLQEMGDSIVAVCNDSIVKIHIHTFTPEKVLEYGRRFGEFVTLKIENMSVQHSQADTAPKREKVKYAVIPVAAGEGIQEYFQSIGAAAVIDGGQTNNPSVETFVETFRKFDAEHIIVLPNNANIVLTANQAAQMYTDTDVRVIPTKSVVEGNCAMSMMNLWCDTVEELLEDMCSGLENVVTGYVTTATRTVNMDGVQVIKDHYIGLNRQHILTCTDDKVAAALELIRIENQRQEREVVIVFVGANVTQEQAQSLEQTLRQTYPMMDIGFVNGKQDVYDFIISLE